MALLSSKNGNITHSFCFTSDAIYAVRFHPDIGIVTGKKDLPADTLQRGAIRRPETCAELLKKLLTEEEKVIETSVLNEHSWTSYLPWKKKATTKDVAICLPAEAVYAIIFMIPSIIGKDVQREVQKRVRTTIPEPAEDLTVHWQTLATAHHEQQVAIVAVRTDILEQYRQLCASLGLKLSSITTPASASWLFATDHLDDATLLISRFSDMPYTSTFVHHQWPIDELLLPSNTSLADHFEQSKPLVQDQFDLHHIPLKRVVFLGAKEEFEQLSKTHSFKIPLEYMSYKIPKRLVGFELPLFTLFSAQKGGSINLLDGKSVPKEDNHG